TFFAEPFASPLNLIAGLLQMLDAFISGNRASNLVSNRLGVVKMDQVSGIGSRRLGDEHRDLPLGQGFADPAAWYLGAKKNAALGRGLGAAAALLVASLRRQQDDRVGRFNHHLR